MGNEEWSAGEDAAGRCPLNPTTLSTTSREDLDARARAMVQPSAPAAVAPAPTLPKAADAPATIAEQRLRDWAAAWMSKDIERYYTFYSPKFGPMKANKDKWMSERKRLVTKPGDISVVLEDIQAKTVSPTRAETTFKQTYRSSNYNDVMVKTLTWELSGKDWLIVRESNR
jgi:outer membrane protein, adhesin transport system